MNYDMNAGYIITDFVRVGDVRFVLGVHSEVPSQFVTWKCKEGRGYYWGRYHSDMLSATKDLLERATQELELCMSGGAKEQPHMPQKEPEDMCL